VEDKIKKIMSEILSINPNEIDDNSSPETILVWDSLKQMNLIVALEEELDIEFDDEEISMMLNYKLIETIIREKIDS